MSNASVTFSRSNTLNFRAWRRWSSRGGVAQPGSGDRLSGEREIV